MGNLSAGLVASLVLLMAVPAWGQTPQIQKKVEKKLKEARDQEKKNLEQLLTEALKNNPDLHVAEAKVRTAEAERDQLRLKLVQQVTVGHANLQQARAAIDTLKAQLQNSRSQFSQGKASQVEVLTGEALLQQAKANLAAAEAKLSYLVGKQQVLNAEAVKVSFLQRSDKLVGRPAEQALYLNTVLAHPQWELIGRVNVEGTMAEKLHRALDAPITITKSPLDLFDLVQILRTKLKGINVILPGPLEGRRLEGRFGITEPVALGAVLQLVEEEFNCRFMLRDYGMRVVDAEEAVHLPPGTVLVVDFWKQGRGANADSGAQPKK